jgi:hypothetical protein
MFGDKLRFYIYIYNRRMEKKRKNKLSHKKSPTAKVFVL